MLRSPRDAGAPPTGAVAALAQTAVSVARMRAIDAAAIDDLGIPRLLLMDHAGVAVASAVRALAAAQPARSVTVCCGTGFNGGDGLAAARHLQRWGLPVRVVLASPRERLSGEPAIFLRILSHLGLELAECPGPGLEPRVDAWLRDSEVLVDALLGIGANGPVREPLASLIAAMNRSGRPIVAADVPSGLDADTGEISTVAVRATVTVTFGLPKRGCFRGEGPAHVGSLVVDPITFPPSLLQPTGGLP